LSRGGPFGGLFHELDYTGAIRLAPKNEKENAHDYDNVQNHLLLSFKKNIR
jgi:hypothetical protein